MFYFIYLTNKQRKMCRIYAFAHTHLCARTHFPHTAKLSQKMHSFNVLISNIQLVYIYSLSSLYWMKIKPMPLEKFNVSVQFDLNVYHPFACYTQKTRENNLTLSTDWVRVFTIPKKKFKHCLVVAQHMHLSAV